MEKHIESLLTVKLKSIYDIKKPIESGVLSLGNSTPITPWQTSNVRIPWDQIPKNHLKGMNFFFSLQPDPSCEWYTSDMDKKVIITKFLEAMEYMKIKQIISRSISIYEIGKHSKIHFHGFLKTIYRDQATKYLLSQFNHRRNLSHITLDLRTIKSVEDRNKMLVYLKKEGKNSIKSLYYN